MEAVGSIGQMILALIFSLMTVVIAVIEALKGLCGTKRLPAPKSILITGATSGIGENLALHYAGTPGVTLSLTGRRLNELERVAKACKEKGAKVNIKNLDVTEKDALAAWIREVDAVAPFDLVIANAGVTENTAKTTGDLATSAYNLFDINVTGLFNTIFPVIEGMKARSKGQVALVSSLASFGGLPASAAYSATKAAVRVYGEGLRGVLFRDGIKVNVVAPGYVKSPMTDANPFPQPGKVSMSFAIRAITDGLSRDVPLIAFPYSTFSLSFIMGSMHYMARDFFARNRIFAPIAYWKKSRKVPAVAAASAPAAATEAAPASSKSTGSRRPKKDL